MCEPKWVMAFGACATSGGFYQNYAAVAGIDKIIPVDIYVPGCPPRPETVIDAIMQLQDRIARSTAIRSSPTSSDHGAPMLDAVQQQLAAADSASDRRTARSCLRLPPAALLGTAQRLKARVRIRPAAST